MSKTPSHIATPWLGLFAALAVGFSWPASAQGSQATPRAREAGSTALERDSQEDGEVGSAPEEQRTFKAPTHLDCEHRVPIWEHEVQEGEHLGIIAGRYGVRSDDLVKLNPALTNPDRIFPGQKIRVCPTIFPRITRTVTHVVQSGDTLSAIAEHYGVSVQDILAAQGRIDANPDHVRVGQELRFEVDGGVVESFQPRPEPVRRSRSRSGSGSKSGARAKVDTRLSRELNVHIKRPHLAFGTQRTISLIERAVLSYQKRHRNGPRVLIGDISRRGGGRLHPHLSHREGRDVDVGFVLRGEAAKRTRFAGVNRRNLDVPKTWTLIKAFLDTREVQVIFMDHGLQKVLYEHALSQGATTRELDEIFQYPRGRGRSHGIIRHWPSHKHHFHVRFR